MGNDDDMSEILATALHNFVVDGGWGEIRSFFDEHALLFGSDSGGVVEGEFGEGEYALFVKFRDLAATTLDGLLRELGCASDADEDRLAEWLRKHAASPANGPREELAKTLLSDVLGVADFATFVRMMRRHNDEIEILEAAGAPKPPSKHVPMAPSFDAAADQSLGENDWELQHAIAQSILSAHQAGKLREQDQAYVGWALALVSVAADDDGALWRDDPARARELYRDLAVQRFNVDLSVAQRTVFEERAARAEAARSAVEEAGGTHDARVKATLSRCDDLQREVAVSRGACVRNEGLPDANLELSYLLIKNLLAKREDLTHHVVEIYDAIHAARPHGGASHLRQEKDQEEEEVCGGGGSEGHHSDGPIFDLVRWCSLEAELATVRKRLDTMLTTGTDAPAASPGVWHEYVDANTNYPYYVNSVTGESQWHQPSDFAVVAAATDKDQDAPPIVAEAKVADDHDLDAQRDVKKQEPSEPTVSSDNDVKDTLRSAKASDVSASLRSLRDAKSEQQQQQQVPPPPVGLPSAIPTWGRRLSPLNKSETKPTEDEKRNESPAENPTVSRKKAGMVLSPIALDYLKKRDIELAELPCAATITAVPNLLTTKTHPA
ncbi:hypothetical protein CTAYLR_001591 [Chrysophaeum taylorii]|uniref:WW domain-containing protein n=1 Tax=Chrysophaeum taylorii TaxID=2483200 RepID=A0AAD7UD97_9STRA|nr:hypothetical protein CTAYLR_001591 [Chrysophaeum taylorii]